MPNIKIESPDISKLQEVAKENNLTLKISENLIQKIRNAHFKERLSVVKIRELYQKDLLNIMSNNHYINMDINQLNQILYYPLYPIQFFYS